MSNHTAPDTPALSASESEIESMNGPDPIAGTTAPEETTLPDTASLILVTAPVPETPATPAVQADDTPAAESFGEIFAEYEARTGSRKASSDEGARQLVGTVIAVTDDAAILDIGLKIEGRLPLGASSSPGTAKAPAEAIKPGDKFPVSIKGRDPETGYYTLSRMKVIQPVDWTALERAFADQSTIVGTVTGLVKGGLTVDVGARAFMPASRSGARDAAEMEKLVGQEIVCRILKLDTAEEDIVVDRRAVTEEEARAARDRRYGEVREGDVVTGEVRSLTDYGAFVDMGGVDGLLHVSDISWTRISSPADVLLVGQQVEAKVLKIDSEKRRISLGMKQLLDHPWDSAAEKHKVGDRVRGVVTRTTDFGAFVELEPGVEGLVHVSEMSWVKKVRKPSDLVKPGDTVEVVILGMDGKERRMSLGLKQALGDPWADAALRFPVGSHVKGPITSMMKFGAFVQLAEGIEGMIHVSEIDPNKRINTPHDVFRIGQEVEAQVIGVASDKRQIRLSIKQMIPTGLDEYLAEHTIGDRVTGRLLEDSSERVRVELGEGVFAHCRLSPAEIPPTVPAENKADLSSLSAMLNARWKTGTPSSQQKGAKGTQAQAGLATIEAPRAGQIRSFIITNIDAAAKTIELKLD